MQVLIVEEDPTLRTRITGALAPEGVDVLSFGRLGPAKEAARRANVDILVLGESVEGRLASDVALLAEWRNPRLGSILLSDRDSEQAEELFDLIPSLQAVLGRHTGPRTLARMAIATARSQEGIVVLSEGPGARRDEDGPTLEEATSWATVEADHPADLMVAALPESTTPTQEAAFAPVEEATAAPEEAPPVPVKAVAEPQAPAESESLAALREKLLQAQKRLAALEMSAPAQELPFRRKEPGASSGVLFTLPSFLRDAEDPADTAQLGEPSPVAAHPAFLPVQAAAPHRRLHLA